jgi:glutamate formiminotransferase/formiminotetrahydrofolate cyclodeaminase
LRVTGSEIVGLVPRAALLDAGRHYLARQGRSIGVPEHELVHIAVRSLGLDEISPFDPATKVVEYCVRDTRTQRWRSGALDAFVDALSTDSPVPGGGSVAAVCGALAAALAAMVANLTFASLADGEARRELERLAMSAQEIKEDFLVAIDADAAAFAAVLAAMRLPRADAAAREVAVRQATRRATQVPLDVLEKSAQAAVLASTAARLGTRAALSDAGVAALCAATAAESAYYNVLINLANLDPVGDADFVAQSRAAAKSALDSSLTHSEAARTAVRTALEAPR